MKKISKQDLIDVLLKFDSELEIDEEKLAEMPDKQKGELYLAIKSVLKYREDFPPDLADAVQQLAKQSVEKQGIQKGDALDSLNLNPDEDGIVLETGEIIEPSDELFPLAKKLDNMDVEEVEQFVDDLAICVSSLCKIKLAKLEKKLKVAKDGSSKDKGKWKTIMNQM